MKGPPKAALQNKAQVCDRDEIEMPIPLSKIGNYRYSHNQGGIIRTESFPSRDGKCPQIRAVVGLEEGSYSRQINAHRSRTPPAAG